MTTSNAWFVFFVSVAVVASSSTLADFSYSVSPAVIRPGESAVLEIRLPETDLLRPPTEDDVPEAIDDLLVKAPGLEMLDQDYKKEEGDYVWRYRFTGYKLGDFFLPPLNVKFGPQNFSTERVPLKIQSERSPEDTELRPDADRVPPPWDWGLLAVLALAIAAAAAGYRYFPRLKRKWKTRPPKVVVTPPPPAENPLEWLRKQLLVLRALLDTSPNDPTAPDRWFSIIKEFTARKTHQPAVAWTTTEMRKRTRGDEALVPITPLLEACDRFKFSKERDGKATTSPGKVTLEWIDESERILL